MKHRLIDRRIRQFAFLPALILAAGLALGCALPSPVPVEDGGTAALTYDSAAAASSSSSSGAYAVDVTDMAGNAVRLSEPASRIVVLDPADCEILFAIGAGDLVVGRTSGCDYPSETNVIPFVTVDNKTDPDLVLLREPQLVVMSAEDAADADLISALASAGVQTVVTNAPDINGAYSAISLLGSVTGRSAEATALVSNLITSLAELQGKISQHDQTVYVELSPLSSGLTTAGGNTIVSALISFLGFHDEFEDQAGFLSITPDQVVGRSPDYILTTTAASASETGSPEETTVPNETVAPDGTTQDEESQSSDSPVSEIGSRTDWDTIDAVKNNRVFYIDPGLITRAGPRLAEAAGALYSILYEGVQP